ncbi:transcription factor PAP1-domain-containing protein [Phyllosticta citribraziliensis]|uniref:Transcription factor PAP1-domain-containing protein n=1 Tax=Phyllosticta citribraziliensis TaxID=989973 RepID=A0ABR1LLV9_9PEZI
MASANNQFNPNLYLTPNQQDLLVAALNSNSAGQPGKSASYSSQNKRSDSNPQQQFPLDGMDPSFFTSPQQGADSEYGAFGLEESPYGEFLDVDGTFDFDPNETGDLLIGGLPGEGNQRSPDGESSEKRKTPPEENDEDPKRREGDEKQAKKPGRKPLTSEPTTKRKAQNRAAQRAFRERKEKHLKDLETKVQELEQASDATNHENGLLRAQVERLQMELREYRKRLSLNASGVGKTQTGFPSLLSNASPGANNFQFEFPRFGALPGSQLLNNGPLSKSSNAPAGGRQNSAGRSMSPSSNTNGVRSPDKASTGASPNSHHSPSTNGTGNTANGSPTLNGPRGSVSSSTGVGRVFQFNSNANSTNDSPSASSVSNYGANSSCGTSPEPSHNSPGNEKIKDSQGNGYACYGNTEGEVTFCEKLNEACGNPRNPVPRALSQSNDKPAPMAATHQAQVSKSPGNDFGLDWLATQNDNQFNPSLFGDYRESQVAVVGDGDFTGGFFNDAFPADFSASPFNFGDGPTPGAANKQNPMEAIQRMQDGDDDEVVPGEDPNNLLSCHKIWDKLQNRQDFKDGTIDIDGLCTELRAKARCSESGVVVDSKDVEAALKRMPENAVL